MNVYDFDGTIYDGDSSVDFWLMCMRRHPGIFLKRLPGLAGGAVLFLLRIMPKTQWKERFFSFLQDIPADDALLSEFWATHFDRIKEWYLKQKQESDLVISASPVFLLEPVCDRLGISLIATRADPATGRITGQNCSGKEKVRRFREEFPDAKIEEFYTDSNNDLPMAALAERAYRVRRNEIREMKAEETYRG